MWEFVFEPFFLLVILPLTLLFITLATLLMVPLALWFATWLMRVKEQKRQRRFREGTIIGLFHPYCNAGGGGERVLWVAINAILTRHPTTKICVYTGDVDATPEEILNKAQTTFNIKVDIKRVHFIYLTMRGFVEASKYPYFTLLLQSLGSIVLGFEAVLKLNPDIFIDTMGYAFTLPIFKYLGPCKTATYTHYPTITEDMMRRVKLRLASHNNASLIARNPVFTWLKMIYYQMFGWLYGFVGRCADMVMVNGTWTEEHINKLWKVPLNTHRVYPPCEVGQLKSLRSLVNEKGPINIISVGQFRPEKDHPLMLQAMYELRTLLMNNEELWNRLRLIFVGSCRHEEDKERVKNLKDLAKHLSLEDTVQFKVNVSYCELLNTYQHAVMGLHAMWNEHFGIGVVECMAAGLIMIAHRSGGPLADIIETSEVSRTGFLASTPEDYARTILEVLALTEDQRHTIRSAARASVDRFSQKEFEKGFLRAIDPLMNSS
ncbi:ALG11 alpha-1,2-mannosyltransferase isoform X1 [Arctopsyche grandis]|uniref:ALG11 alpha-1,2-mannosyltransferase isoform X1 n=1 Tax=Arctopsyche grandis TaxID=121162 RepID=UPI00406D65A3